MNDLHDWVLQFIYFFFNYFIFEIKDIIMNEESIIRTYEKNLVIKIWKKSFDFQTL